MPSAILITFHVLIHLILQQLCEVETIIILISWMKSWAHIDHTARRHSSEKSNFRNYSLDHFVVAPISFQHMLPFFI